MTAIKNLAKRLPKGLQRPARSLRFSLQLLAFAMTDYKRYKAAAFGNPANNTRENVRAKIAMSAHSIEKGLCHINKRIPFGESSINSLIEALRQYSEGGYVDGSQRFAMGLSVLKEYIQEHESIGLDMQMYKEQFEYLSTNVSLPLEGLGGIKSPKNVDNGVWKVEWANFLKSRSSVREFSHIPVDTELIHRAIFLARLTPSSCNRQPWRSYIIKNSLLIEKVLKIQNGLRGYDIGASTLILVTVDESVYGGPAERVAGYIDGGMFAVTLLYSLHSSNVATCVLNTSLSIRRELEFRELLGIGRGEVLICLIIAGYPADGFKVPLSTRDGKPGIIIERP